MDIETHDAAVARSTIVNACNPAKWVCMCGERLTERILPRPAQCGAERPIRIEDLIGICREVRGEDVVGWTECKRVTPVELLIGNEMERRSPRGRVKRNAASSANGSLVSGSVSRVSEGLELGVAGGKPGPPAPPEHATSNEVSAPMMHSFFMSRYCPKV